MNYGQSINNGITFNGFINTQGEISSEESSLTSAELSTPSLSSPYTMTTLIAAQQAAKQSIQFNSQNTVNSISINKILAQTSDAILLLKNPESVYCPTGSFSPILVSNGYYTISTYDSISSYGSTSNVRTSQVLCPAGSYCVDGVRKSPP